MIDRIDMTDVPLFDAKNLPKWARQINVRLQNLFQQHAMDGPVCHVGSLLNGEGMGDEDAKRWQSNFKDLKNNQFVGVDLFPGPNVHVVGDLCSPDFFLPNEQLRASFGLVFCSALFEHVQNPFAAAVNVEGLIRPGGHIYFAGPWVWGYHPYPDDYWRLSFSALRILFPKIVWKQWYYTGTNRNVGIEIDDPKHERSLFAQRGATGAASLITDRGMPYLNIGAIGQRPAG